MSIEITVKFANEQQVIEALELNGLHTQVVGTSPDGRLFLMITTDKDGGYTVGSVIPGLGNFSGSILTMDTGRVPALTVGAVMTYLAQVG